jgi:hypothetical protein
MTAQATKYYNKPLLDFSRTEIETCLGRLAEQATIYAHGGLLTKRRMAVRGLFVAALTLNATAVWTAKRLESGRFAMSTQSLFFKKRWKQWPNQWGRSAKSCLARAWSGYSLGADAVCIDRHLERMGYEIHDAVTQWKVWFDLYESMYGAGETVLCVRWHTQLLDWISYHGPRPEAWK